MIRLLECALRKELRSFTVDLRFQVQGGNICAVMGENGTGKTTILQMIAGLTAPDDGRISLSGDLLYDGAAGFQVPSSARSIGYIAQRSSVFPHLTVYENVAYGPRSLKRSKDEIADLVTRWLSALGIADLAGVKAGRLSGGQQQRVVIARAFAVEPALLMLDEPYEALDVEGRATLTAVVRDYVHEHQIPCLCVTHHNDEVKTLCDQVVLIDQGHVIWTGLPSDADGCRCHTLHCPL